MKRLLKSRLVLSLAALIMITATIAVPLSSTILHSYAASSSTRNLVYHKGLLMPKTTTYAIYWLPPTFNGSPLHFEKSGNDASYESLIQRFFGDVGETSFYNILTQYSASATGNIITDSSTFGGFYLDTRQYQHADGSTLDKHGNVVGTKANPLLDPDIRAEITHVLQDTANWHPGPSSPTPGTNTMFFVFTGFSVQSCNSLAVDGLCSYKNMCGYHYSFSQGTQDVIYADMPESEYLTGSRGCLLPASPNGDLAADSEISWISHELFEAITDPHPFSGWIDRSNPPQEIADKCQFTYGIIAQDGHNVALHGHNYIVQQEWSNATSSCILDRPVGHFQFSPSSVNVTAGPGQNPSPQTLTMTNGGSGTLTWSLTSTLPSWLAVNSTSGSLAPGTSASIKLTFSLPATPGTYSTTLIFSAPDADNSPATVSVIATAVENGWPMFGYNPQHTHYNPNENILNPTNVSSLALDWTATTTGIIQKNDSPVVVNGIAYIGDEDGKLYAFNASTGAPLWTYPTGSRGESAPTVVNNVVYFGNEAGNLIALNAATGALIWNTDIPNDGMYGSPTVVNGIVYIGGISGNVDAFNAQTGGLIWGTRFAPYITSSPAVVNGVVYVSFKLNGSLYALDATTGAILWYGAIASGGTDGSPAVADGMVYIAAFEYAAPNYNVTLYAFNASGCGSNTCAPVWAAPVGTKGGDGVSSPAVVNGVVYFGSRDGTLYAFDDKTGVPLWTWTNPTPSTFEYSSPAIANGVLYDATSPYTGTESTVYAFNAQTGALLWTYGMGNLNFTESLPAVVNGIVYIGAYYDASPYNGILFAFHLLGA